MPVSLEKEHWKIKKLPIEMSHISTFFFLACLGGESHFIFKLQFYIYHP